MKKIFYILAGALFFATACQRESFNDGRSTTVAPGPGDLGVLDFTVDYPESGFGTRATMGEATVPSTLYIAVFSYEGGYLQNWIPAELVKPAVSTEPGMKVTYQYKAYLPINTNEIFHFIGDAPDLDPTFSYEPAFIRSMVTKNKAGAFWQRVVVEGGVAAKKNADGSYDLDENGNYKIDLNANGYDATDNPNPLRHVVMIRNFAKIDVASADTNFDVLEWALVNVPKYGTVAPWSANSTGDVVGFNVEYTSIKDYLPESEGGTGLRKLGTFYDELIDKDDNGYHGYYGTVPTAVDGVAVPEDALIDVSEPSAFVQAGVEDPGLYMYERCLPSLEKGQPATMILIRLHWKTAPDGADFTIDTQNDENNKHWYLIELLDNEGEYMPILRNIKYKFHLSGIDEKGYPTSSQAFNGKILGNVSTSLETSTLNELLVGTHKIVVQNMDFSFFNDEETEQNLEFQYFPLLTGDPVFMSSGDDVPDNQKVHITITLKNVTGYDPAIRSLSHIAGEEEATLVTRLPGVTETTTDGSWGLIPYTMFGSGSDPKKSIIRVQGSYGTGLSIFRDVVVTVMPKPDFTEATTVSPLTSDTSGQNVTVTIGLPEGMGSSMFPIQVRIEAENNCLSTTDPKLPVHDGISTFNSKIPATDDHEEIPAESEKAGKRTFYYIRTIEYSEYYHPTGETPYTYNFPCVFQTTKTSENAPTRIKISDSQGRFNSVIKDLKVGSGS